MPWLGIHHDWHTLNDLRLANERRKVTQRINRLLKRKKTAEEALKGLVNPMDPPTVKKARDQWKGILETNTAQQRRSDVTVPTRTTLEDTARDLNKWVMDDFLLLTDEIGCLQTAAAYLQCQIKRLEPSDDEQPLAKLRKTWPGSVSVRNGIGFGGLMQYAHEDGRVSIQPRSRKEKPGITSI